MYICIYNIYMHRHAYTYVYIHINTYIYTHTRTHIYIHTHTYIYKHTHTYICVCGWVCVYIYGEERDRFVLAEYEVSTRALQSKNISAK